MHQRPTVGALFAGYGGLDLAVRDVWPDAHVSWVSEFDAAPSRILAQRFPDAPNHGDVTQIDWANVTPVDIITGGSPCQDLSHAGKRAGMKAGTRSGLWASMCDAIDIIRPSLVVWENVRGALSAEATAGDVERCEFCVGGDGEPHLRALGRVLGDLAELGYDAAWYGLRAADVDATHGRWRVFVGAWPAADAESYRRVEGWAESARLLGRSDAPVGRDADVMLPTPTVSDSNGVGAHGDGGLDLRTAVSLLPTPRATRGGSGTETMYGLGAERVNDARTQGQVTLLPTPVATDANGARNATSSRQDGSQHRGGTTLGDVAHLDSFGDYAPAVERWTNVIGRPAPAPTEPTGKGGAHRLSPRFVEWMMGLPDGWVTDTDTSRNEQLKALGNGVVPQQAAAAIRWLLAAREQAAA